MTARRVVLAGASGFIGGALASAYRAAGDEVVTVGRGAGSDVRWSEPEALRAAVDGAALVVNTAGRSINCRWTARNRADILSSRVDSSRAIAAAIEAAAVPPPLWANASGAAIYGDAGETPHTERSAPAATGFLAGVVRQWEAALFERELPSTRRVAMRFAVVVDDPLFLGKLVLLARLGLGGPQHDGPWPNSRRRRELGIGTHRRSAGGRQRFSWIRLEDVVRIVRFLEEHPELEGPVNVAAPGATDNRGLMAAVRGAIGAPFGIPAPRWVMEPAGLVVGTETELVYRGSWALPEKLLAAGYEFRHPELVEALRASLLRPRPATMEG